MMLPTDLFMKRARNRLLFIALLCSLGFIGVFFRIAHKVWNRPHATAHRSSILRGPILDRRGMALALTEEASTIASSPREIFDPEFTARQLAPLLGEDPVILAEKIRASKTRPYLLLKRQLDNYLADRIIELNLPGIHREREYRRVYPAGALAGNLIGFVGRNQMKALAGLERIFNAELTSPRAPGSRKAYSLHLTIDSLIQRKAEIELKAALKESGSKRAVAIIMDIQNGEILAMANAPDYDPNNYHKTTPFQRANWALRFHFEPGSTAKIFMMAILFTENVVRPGETFYCNGRIKLGSTTVRCKSGGRTIRHGRLTLAQILERSCNVGTIKAMSRVPVKRLHSYMKRLAFGRATGILPSGETSGYFPPMSMITPSSKFYIPIGQSFSVTPMQLLRAGASIANGGRLLRPLLLRKVDRFSIETGGSTEALSQRNPFPAEANAAALELMRGVILRGTGRRAYLRSMPSAGKTGTGQKSTARGYVEKYVASFIGFFPAAKPRYGMLVLFDEPRGHAGGGSLAAPVFRKILKAILPVINPETRRTRRSGLQPLPRRKKRIDPNHLPDFRGLSAREALRIARGTYYLKVKLYGSGYVYRQSPPPRTNPRSVKLLRLYLGDH